MKLVSIEWYDAMMISGWHSQEDVNNCEHDLCTSVGYLVFKDKNWICLASSLSGLGDLGGLTYIPKKWVHNIKRIRGNKC
jgi:hypothetical protein